MSPDHQGGDETSGASTGANRADTSAPGTPNRRRVLQSGLIFGAGDRRGTGDTGRHRLAAGVGGAALYSVSQRPDVIVTDDGVQVRNSRLNRDMELTDSTNEGRGIQRLIWSVPTDQRVMALTFDDGPTPSSRPRSWTPSAASIYG